MEDYDLTVMQLAEPGLGIQTGEGVLRTHPRSVCEGRDIPCCIHSPSEHRMRTWPMNWRGDTQVMERICPHGTGHPDPDHMAWVRSLTPPHLCLDDVLEKAADEDPQYSDLHFEYRCKYPHLEWQEIHSCDGCCR